MKWPLRPFFDTPSIATSIIYFLLVFVFVINRSKILDLLGKLLTPAIILILLLIIGTALFSYNLPIREADFIGGDINVVSPFSEGILMGYQTFDALGAIVAGGVIIVSIHLKKKDTPYLEKKTLIRRAGWLAGLGLFLVYTGLILTGALMHDEFDADISRTALLNGISIKTLGSTANLLLSILVSLACFTTAVGIVTGTSDFVKERCHDSQRVYYITAIIGCIIGVVMGQFDVGYIIAVALPALMFIYPITIVLIVLNVMPERFASARIFRSVVITTIIFSIPDFLGSVGLGDLLGNLTSYIPLSAFSMGWVLPAASVFILSYLMVQTRHTASD